MSSSQNTIFPVRIGYSNAVLVLNGHNSILIDTGAKNNIHRFHDLFKNYKIQASDIKLIILTHTHLDHTGNLNELVQLTGARVIVHKNEFENLKKGFIPIPDGQGIYTRFISGLGKLVRPAYISPKPFAADIINEDEMDLNNFGMNGKIISTPGHTSGSQSVIIGKQLISGDTFINLPNGTIFPHFANDPKTLIKTWEKLFQLGVKEIFPGHGKKLNIEETLAEYEKWKKKLSE